MTDETLEDFVAAFHQGLARFLEKTGTKPPVRNEILIELYTDGSERCAEVEGIFAELRYEGPITLRTIDVRGRSIPEPNANDESVQSAWESVPAVRLVKTSYNDEGRSAGVRYQVYRGRGGWDKLPQIIEHLAQPEVPSWPTTPIKRIVQES